MSIGNGYDHQLGVAKLISPSRWPKQAKRIGQGKIGGNFGGSAAVPAVLPLADGAVFEGDFYAKTAGFLDGGTGTTWPDGKTGSGYVWIGTQGSTNAVAMEFLRSQNGRVRVNRQTDGTILVTVSDGTHSFTFKSTSTVLASASGWTLVAFSYNTNFGIGLKVGVITINGGANEAVVVADASAAFNVDHTEPSWAIGATTAGANPLTGRMRDLSFCPNKLVDWTDPAQIALVYNAGAMVDPGPHGALPYGGTVPAIYCSIRAVAGVFTAADFFVNKGGGVNFTLTHIAGAKAAVALRWRKAMVVYGHSIDFGALATNTAEGYAYLTARAFGRCVVMHAVSGALVDDQITGGTVPGVTLQVQTNLAADLAEHPESAFIVGGGYNSRLVTLANTLGWLKIIRDLIAATGKPYIKVGTPKGGAQGTNASAFVETEWGSEADAVKIDHINYGDGTGANPTGDQGIWGAAHWYDWGADQVANGLQRASDLGFAVTVPAGVDDAYDIAGGVPPRSLRDVSGDLTFTPKKIGIHANTAGHSSAAGTASGTAPGGVIVQCTAIGGF